MKKEYDEPVPKTLREIEKWAAEKAPPDAYQWLISGAELENTINVNRKAFEQTALRPRVLRDVSNIDTTIEIFGQKLKARKPPFEETEVKIKCKILNQFVEIGMPNSYKVAP